MGAGSGLFGYMDAGCAAFSVLGILILVAAVVDARTRTYPAPLAVAVAAAGAWCALARGGTDTLGAHCLAACAVSGLLVVFEIAWRRHHDGTAGLGMGDVKYLFGTMLADPAYALVGFSVGLALLALAGTVCRRPSLPLLPFVAAGTALIVVPSVLAG